MKQWHGKIAIVTGASAGIGQSIAKKLVEEGMIVVGIARRKGSLEKLSANLKGLKGVLHGIQTDMTKEEDILKTFEYVTKNLGPIHVLVNNAGLSGVTPLSSGKTEAWKQILETNVLGLSIMTRQTVQNMIFNKIDGHIIHINSIYGHYVTKRNDPMYSASKFAVTSLTESLRLELTAAKSRIKVTSICPGYVDTELLDVVSETSDGLFSKDQLTTFKQENPYLQPEDVVDCVFYVLNTPPHVQIHDIIIRPIGEKL